MMGMLAIAGTAATPGREAIEGSSKSVDANNYESPYTETLPTSLLSLVYFQCPSLIGCKIKSANRPAEGTSGSKGRGLMLVFSSYESHSCIIFKFLKRVSGINLLIVKAKPNVFLDF